MTRGAGVAVALLLLTLGAPAGPVRSAAPAGTTETIYVRADKPKGDVRLVTGFLHGLDGTAPLSLPVTAVLGPRHWRLAKEQTYDFVAALGGMSITYEVNAHAMWREGSAGYKPWLDWEAHEAYVRMVVSWVKQQRGDASPAFYDIWNEPDGPGFWRGNHEQLVETFVRTYRAVKEADPDARLVGPSVAAFRPSQPGVANVVGFLSELYRDHGILLDAVSWHENGSCFAGGGCPAQILEHANRIRAGLKETFPADYEPELHINEYAGSRIHLDPGYNVGYLYYLDAAGVDASNRACWNVRSTSGATTSTWSDCWAGLNGLLMRDGRTPAAPYWIYKAYADTDGQRRLPTTSTSATTNALASIDDDAETLHLIVGRYRHGAAAEVTVRITGYPYDHERVVAEIGRIRHDERMFDKPPTIVPMPDGPERLASQRLEVVGGRVAVRLEDFADHDAYLIKVRAAFVIALPRLSVGHS